MSEPKPFASLGPLLLARKGLARPAMKTGFGPRAEGSADLDPELSQDNAVEEWEDMEALEKEPEVKRQQDGLVHRIADSNLAAAQAREAQRARLEEGKTGRRVAFTLRLDAARHLKLKLASTVKGVSAQQLVTEALDRMLADMPEIETLAAQVKRDDSKA